jgi:hypothetical protein
MTLLLYAGVGVSLSSCLIHIVLGVARPPDWKHLAFSGAMAMLCVYLLLERRFYYAETADAGVRIARSETPFVVAYLALLGWFIREYANLRVPRWLIVVFYSLLAASLVYNFVAPYGIYYPSEPTLTKVRSFGGEAVTNLEAPLGPIQFVWYLLALGVGIAGLVAGAQLTLRGDRLRGVMLMTAMSASVLPLILDMVRDSVGGEWPYLVEFGAVSSAVILSVQLAVEYRIRGMRLKHLAESEARALQRLARMALAVKDMANTPLQTLESSVDMLERDLVPAQKNSLARIRRSARRLRQLDRMLDPYVAQVHWSNEDESFDPLAVIERTGNTAGTRDS